MVGSEQGAPARSRGALGAQAEASYLARQVLLPIQRFIYTERTGGLLLLAAALVALVWVNSPWQSSYFAVWEQPVALLLPGLAISQDLRHWVNDGLMAVFFYVVGLEIKRELLHGELAERRRAVVPVAAACGDMLVRALIYVLVNDGGTAARGWGIPMATDTAFALGILALLGGRIPAALKVFLLALAIVDDVGAIVVIAVFYTADLHLLPLIAGLAVAVLIAVLNRLGLRTSPVYTLLAVGVWLAVLESGIHATLAGVLLALLTPARAVLDPRRFSPVAESTLLAFQTAIAQGAEERAEEELGRMEELVVGTEAPLDRWERTLHPWTSYVVLPLFALANAGVVVSGATLTQAIADPLVWGIVAGLVMGKPVGITLATSLVVRFTGARLGVGMTWPHVIGAGMVGGIGFTVPLFIAGLAFSTAGALDASKLAILIASTVAGAVSYGFLRLTAAR